MLDSLGNSKEKIKNIKAYILTSLYNAAMTLNLAEQSDVNRAFRSAMSG